MHRLPEMDQAMLGVFALRGTLIPLYSPVGPLGIPLTRWERRAGVYAATRPYRAGG